MQPFALGQRWISDTESELGMGIIVAIEGRRLSLEFPANGEQRHFATDSAPITRIRFAPGDEIVSEDGWRLRVDEVHDDNGLLIYQGERLDVGEQSLLFETRLNHHIRLSRPQDRLFAGQLDPHAHYIIRHQCRWQHQQVTQEPLRALQGPKVGLIAHQLFIANEVGHRHAPRVLLADEVGLGKTIEAGHILHQQLLSGRAARVLVLVPETLQHQWLVEMLRRFNLPFALFDAERLTEASADGDNPFETEQLILCAIDLLQDPKWQQAAISASWDLLVVDEAHHLVWADDDSGWSYRMVETMAGQIPGILLLTATPDRLGHQSHFARLRLIDPDRFYCYETFVGEEAHYLDIANAADALLNDAPLSSSDIDAIKHRLPDRQVAEELSGDESQARRQLLSALLDRHGTGRVLFRNSRASVRGFTQRVLHQYPLPMPAAYQDVAPNSASSQAEISVTELVSRGLHPEKHHRDWSGPVWWQFDPRVDWLMDFVKRHKGKKILVIAAHASTALALEEALRTREGLAAAVFHEGLSIIERDRAAAFFAQAEGGATVMICSEIGSEGRNFQFSHHLVLFDLPQHPDLLEQRIGRLDRIGQQHNVNIHVPYFEHSAQQRLFSWYHQGLNAFEQTCPSGDLIHAQFSDRLQRQLASQNEDIDLISETAVVAAEHKATMEAGRDRLLELNSNGGDDAERLVQAIQDTDDNTDFISFMMRLWDVLGVSQDDKGEQQLVLTPGEHMLFAHYPGLAEDGVTLTFERDTALARDDVQFITPVHPLVTAGIDLIVNSEIGCATVALLKNRALPAGTWLLELLYVADAVAPRQTQIQRFLPPTPIRLLLDKSGNDLADKLSFDALNLQLKTVDRATANQLISALMPDLRKLLNDTQTTLTPRLQALVDGGKRKANQQLGAELARLRALADVNPNVRTSEILALEQQISEVNNSLDNAQVQLDGIRLIVNSPS